VQLQDLIVSRIRTHGPMTVAAFMDLALYHPELGYYATAPRRSGRSGDFITSVDVGPFFGEMIAVQLAEMWDLLKSSGADRFHLVEAGAGDGRLARDILEAVSRAHPDLAGHLHITVVDRSPAAAQAQRERFATESERVTSSESLPHRVTGVILANELLDALPVHVIVSTNRGLREVYVTERDGALKETCGPLSDARIEQHLAALDVTLQEGWRVEVGLTRTAWITEAASALARGFLLLFDYGHDARELYSAGHRQGTLMAYSRHTTSAASAAGWLEAPGGRDITAEVDLTSITLAAERAGLKTLGVIDQTYFLLGLGITDRLDAGDGAEAIGRRLAARTLLMPGGLGSTMKVLAFAKEVGQPELRGLMSGRLT
jgi:SAM-dependent MidA family methyltransferase